MPSELLPDVAGWEHAQLHKGVVEALAALPTYFRTETFISGIPATDLHALHGVLGVAIEEQVVATLNTMRGTWDPDGKYALYSFVRQPQTFPDVLLQRPPSAAEASEQPLTIMGIELKGWYMLAAEGEPNFRYLATPQASGPYDLLVVVPWTLAQVISGHPVVFAPSVVGSRIAAERRNTYWKNRKTRGGTNTIISPEVSVAPYQTGRGLINDQAADDSGGNFGRIARSRILDEYIAEMKDRSLCGVRLRHWLVFLLAIQGKKKTDAEIAKALATLASDVSERSPTDMVAVEAIASIIGGLRRLVLPVGNDPDE